MESDGLDGRSTTNHSLASSSSPILEQKIPDIVIDGVDRLEIGDVKHSNGGSEIGNDSKNENSGLEVTCFTEVKDNVALHFQIIRLQKQIYAWIGCHSAKLGHLYAAATTRPNNAVSVTNLLGGGSDNTGSGIARRIVLKTGLNVILACNIPKNNPNLEVDAEKLLIQKLIKLGYTKPKSQVP